MCGEEEVLMKIDNLEKGTIYIFRIYLNKIKVKNDYQLLILWQFNLWLNFIFHVVYKMLGPTGLKYNLGWKLWNPDTQEQDWHIQNIGQLKTCWTPIISFSITLLQCVICIVVIGAAVGQFNAVGYTIVPHIAA